MEPFIIDFIPPLLHFSTPLAFRIRSVSLSSQQVLCSFPLLRCQLSFKSSTLLFCKKLQFLFSIILIIVFASNPTSSVLLFGDIAALRLPDHVVQLFHSPLISGLRRHLWFIYQLDTEYYLVKH